MANELHSISRATADLRMRLGFVIFVRGPLRVHADAVEDLWTRLNAGLLRKRFTRYRLANHTSWAPLPESTQSSFAEFFGMRGSVVGSWGLELAEPGEERGDGQSSLWLQLTDLAPVRGVERASHLRVLFPDDTPQTTIAVLGEWAINRLPLWWGAGGFAFHHTSGPTFIAHERMAVLAKRYWAVQIQDMTSLQWDALRGMPSINWLTVIGKDFAEANGMTMDAVAQPLPNDRVFARRGPFGIALAVGSGPKYGDINIGENLEAYVQVAQRLQPLLLSEHTPMFGPFAKPSALAAWLARFTTPQAWLECDIAAE